MVRFEAPVPQRPVNPGPVPRFSVVIAAYQAAATIGEAVRSAVEQEPPPLEVVVCDDGSTDDLSGALAPFGDEVRLVRIPHGGEAAAKNAAIRAARGEYVVILDADDRFLPGRLAALGELAARRPDLDLLTTDAYLELDGRRVGRCYHEGFVFASTDQRAAILQGNFVFGQVAVRRRRFVAVGGFDDSIQYTTDWDCWIRMVLDGSLIGLVDEPLAIYRMHEAAMSASREAMYAGRVETLTKTLADHRLSLTERDEVARVRSSERARVARERLRSALLRGAPDARGLAREVARSQDQRAATRAKAMVSAAAPGIVSALLRRRDRSSWVGVGDVRYARRPS